MTSEEKRDFIVEQLIKDPNLKFSELASSVGLTRERVRQIAKKELGLTAQDRIQREAVERLQRKMNNRKRVLEHEPFILEAKKRGLVVELLDQRRFLVNGKLTVLRHTGQRVVRGVTFYRLRKPWEVVDVVVTEIALGWMIIPYDSMIRQTMFRFNPSPTKLTYTMRHDWGEYLNKWSVFDESGGSVGAKRDRVPGEQVTG